VLDTRALWVLSVEADVGEHDNPVSQPQPELWMNRQAEWRALTPPATLCELAKRQICVTGIDRSPLRSRVCRSEPVSNDRVRSIVEWVRKVEAREV